MGLNVLVGILGIAVGYAGHRWVEPFVKRLVKMVIDGWKGNIKMWKD